MYLLSSLEMASLDMVDELSVSNTEADDAESLSILHSYSDFNISVNCKYYDIDDFNFFISQQPITKEMFFLLELNSRSLPKNFVKISTFLDSISKKPDCITVSESWLHASVESLYGMSGYALISKPRTSKRGGGVAIYLSTSYTYKVINININLCAKCCEYMAIECSRENVKSNMIILALYRPPGQDVQMFIDVLRQILELFTTRMVNRQNNIVR